MKSNKTTEAEFKEILAWLLAGAKQWAKICNYAEPLPEIFKTLNRETLNSEP